jgi:hypothetical protein
LQCIGDCSGKAAANRAAKRSFVDAIDRWVALCAAFSAAGAVGGSIWHAIKGAKNAPKGWGNRFRGALAASKARAPVVGGSFAIWGGMFASFDCTLAYVRQKVRLRSLVCILCFAHVR